MRGAFLLPASGAIKPEMPYEACGWVTTSGTRNPLVTGAGIAYNSAEENTKRVSAR